MSLVQSPATPNKKEEEEEGKAMNTLSLEANCVQILAHQFQLIRSTNRSCTPSPLLMRSLLEKDNEVVSGVDGTVAANSNTNSSPEPFLFSSSPWNVITPEKETKKSGSAAAADHHHLVKEVEAVSLEASSAVSSGASWASLIPTADDPIDNSFIMCLDSCRDVGRINPVHIVIRRHIFEVRRTANTGRVFFQCACCKHRPRADRAKLSTLAPQAVSSIYRAFVRFMMEHVSSCRDIPADIRKLDARARKIANADRKNGNGRGYRSVGVKDYWTSSAKRMGLMNGSDGKSIVYRDHLTAYKD